MELAGTTAAGEFANSWVRTLTAKYRGAFDEGLFYTDETREIAEQDTERHREPFVS